ncbi:hypothetical protein SDC9_107997 [bioreactor metagenome]|uniref:Uncharacterized protein n=1 Tax=bioreactor metagenome TaxID=1076179 RepID=A0A645BD91_9ZZZZ
MVGKHARPAGARARTAQQLVEVVAVEDVVAQHQRAGAAVQELFANQKGLRQPIGTGLHRVLQANAPLAAVAQQLLETRRVLRRADDQNVANTRQHQRAERVVDHWLVIDRQQLLADRQCGGMQARARASGQDDALALRGSDRGCHV